MIREYLTEHKRNPTDTTILDKLSSALVETRRYNEAAEVLRFRLRLQPDSAETHTRLANLYAGFGYSQAALEHRVRALELEPRNPSYRAWLAVAQWHASDLDGCLSLCEGLIAEGVASSYLHSFYLTARLHRYGESRESLRQAHEAWQRAHCANIEASVLHSNSRDPERRLRIGYLAGEFNGGPAFHFVMPLIRAHNHEEFEIYCYHTRPHDDAVTPEYVNLVDGWREATKLSEAEIHGLIRSDAIDILVDLSGQYPDHGLRIFKMRPAPVQVSIPNYPCTTGLSDIDYIFTDRWTCPENHEDQYSERVRRIDSGYFSYLPPSHDWAREDTPPAVRNGYVTLGMFQRPAKTNPPFWRAVAQILDRTPGARLLIHNPDRELDREGSAAQRFFIENLAAHGIGADRLLFRGGMPLEEHLACVGSVDMSLDTFPYNGQTTTCDCLLMGVPVVVLEGATHVSRVGSAILARVGLPSLVAQSVEEYVERAVQLASDVDTLVRYRCSIPSQFKSSSMTNGLVITRQIELAYRDIWRQWCLKEATA
ncbi:MAG TPA: hypothetical protein VER03_17910 [Bryobacteraceae bacterium]|nr:hypothetical protein [Bryobacteraceae bacterium]